MHTPEFCLYFAVTVLFFCCSLSRQLLVPSRFTISFAGSSECPCWSNILLPVCSSGLRNLIQQLILGTYLVFDVSGFHFSLSFCDTDISPWRCQLKAPICGANHTLLGSPLCVGLNFRRDSYGSEKSFPPSWASRSLSWRF